MLTYLVNTMYVYINKMQLLIIKARMLNIVYQLLLEIF